MRHERDPDGVTSHGLLDFGRNRLHLAAVDRSDVRVIALAPPRPGLVIRWRDVRGCERITDRIIRTASNPSHRQGTDAATALVAGAGELIADHLDGRMLQRVAVPPAMGPTCRRIVGDGLSFLALPDLELVDRPVAALASWRSARHRLGGEDPDGLVLVVDNDGGELSGLVADLSNKRLLAVEPISTGPGDDVDTARERLRALARRAAGEQSWPAVSSSFEMIVTSGSGADHPGLTELLDELFPATPRPQLRTEIRPDLAVIEGLGRLDALADLRCSWPTTPIRNGGRLVRAAGPWQPIDDDSVVVSLDRPLTTGAEVDGEPLSPAPLRSPIGSFTTLRLDPSGALVIEGAQVPPLVLRTSWPVSPEASGVLPQTIDNVEPQLGGHPQ